MGAGALPLNGGAPAVPAAGPFALRLTGGAKRYHGGGQEQCAFEAVDLEVRRGEVFALLGPSGCGKSTLLRTLAGLEPLSAGHLEIGAQGLTVGRTAEPTTAEPIGATGAAAGGAARGVTREAAGGGRAVGIAFQEPLLLPWLTVAENVALGLRYRANRWPSPSPSPDGRGGGEAVGGLLRDFGLGAVAQAYPDELSGGQAQRASLARTVVTRPAILLLDEPFAALDPRTRGALQDWLLDVVHRRGLSVLLVTHDAEEAVYLGDRVGLMSARPGTITRIWEIEHSPVGQGEDGHAGDDATRDGPAAPDGAPPTAPRRWRDDARLAAIRREILAHYQTDVPGQPALTWVI